MKMNDDMLVVNHQYSFFHTIPDEKRTILKKNFILNFHQVDYDFQMQRINNGFKEENRFRNWYTGKRY